MPILISDVYQHSDIVGFDNTATIDGTPRLSLLVYAVARVRTNNEAQPKSSCSTVDQWRG